MVKTAQGIPRRMWIDDIKSMTIRDDYEKIKGAAEDRLKWRGLLVRQTSVTDEDS